MSDSEQAPTVIQLDDLDSHSATELCLAAQRMLTEACESAGKPERELYSQALSLANASLELVTQAYRVCSDMKTDGELHAQSLEELMDIEEKTKAYAIDIIRFAASHQSI